MTLSLKYFLISFCSTKKNEELTGFGIGSAAGSDSRKGFIKIAI